MFQNFQYFFNKLNFRKISKGTWTSGSGLASPAIDQLLGFSEHILKSLKLFQNLINIYAGHISLVLSPSLTRTNTPLLKLTLTSKFFKISGGFGISRIFLSCRYLEFRCSHFVSINRQASVLLYWRNTGLDHKVCSSRWLLNRSQGSGCKHAGSETQETANWSNNFERN